MEKTLVSTSSGTFAAQAAAEILKKGGSAADAVAGASMVQIVDAAGTYVSFAGMMVALYYEASTGKVFSIDSDYAIPAQKEGDNLTRLYKEGKLGAGVLVPGYFAGLRDMLAHFGQLPFEQIVAPAVERCKRGFEPHERLIKRLQKRSATNPPSVETFELVKGKVIQKELERTLLRIQQFGVDYMYSGEWGEKFVETVQGAGGVITLDDMKAYHAQVQEAITTRYRGFTLYAPPPENAGGLITLFILRMLERLDLRQQEHFTKDPDAFIQLLSGLRAYMPFLNRLLGNLDEAAFSRALGGFDVQLENALDTRTIDRLWEAIRQGKLETVPMEKPINTDVVAARDAAGNIAILVHSACATTGRDGLVVEGISLPRMAVETPGGIDKLNKRVYGIFAPVMAISPEKIVAVAAIHASLYEKQSSVLVNVMEYGLPLSTANELPTPIFPDYDQTGAVTEVLFPEQFQPAFLEGLRQRGLRFKDVREGGLGRFVGKENLDALESPLVGIEVDRISQGALGVTTKHYDGKVLQN